MGVHGKVLFKKKAIATMMRGGQKQRLRTTAQKAKSKAAAEEEARKELFTSDTTPQTIRQRYQIDDHVTLWLHGKQTIAGYFDKVQR